MLGWFKKKIRKSEDAVKTETAASPEVDGADVSYEKEISPGESSEKISETIAEKKDETNVLTEIASEVTADEIKKSEDAVDEKIEPDDTNLKNAEESKDNKVFSAGDNTQEDDKDSGQTETKASLFGRLKSRLAKTRESFVARIDHIFLGKKEIDDDLLDELEEILITSDIGINTVQELLDEARKKVARKELGDPQALKSTLKEKMQEFLSQSEVAAELVMPENGPFVILVLGVNGVGKTTTIGKLAYKFKQAGNKVLLVAADTFRAAAIDQIKIWGERIGVQVSAQQPGADPSSVVFDALEYAKNKDFDVIIIDTAGRLHTKVNLMEELKKIKRVMEKKCPGAPHETMLVLDATTGQNAVSQARLFNEAVRLTGLALTKLDGTAKGGIVINISREFKIPIRFVGIGEKMTDLRDFDSQEFVQALFEK